MKGLTHLSLFSGIGGLDLAAEWAGFRTLGQCEWAEYPTKVLEKHWPDVPRWKDIRTLTGGSFYERTGRRTVDVISGGFPCQPFSVAGKQRGKEDDRYLWPEMVRVIKELRPTWVIGENVAGIVRMALPDILSELEACGYRTRAFLIPACAVGARHRRYRVAIVGYAEHHGLSPAAVAGSPEAAGRGQQERKEAASEPAGAGEPGNRAAMGRTKNMENPGCVRRGKPGDVCEQPGRAEPERAGEAVAHADNTRELQQARGQQYIRAGIGISSEDVQHPNSAGCKEQHVSGKPEIQGFSGGGYHKRDVCNAAGKGLQDGAGKPLGGQGTPEQEPERPDRRSIEPLLGRMADGIPSGLDGDLDFLINHYWDMEPDIPRIATGIEHRADRLKGLGNAVVPQQFYLILKIIYEIESMIQTGQLRFE